MLRRYELIRMYSIGRDSDPQLVTAKTESNSSIPARESRTSTEKACDRRQVLIFGGDWDLVTVVGIY